jgi:hypothetical protein
MCLSAVNTQEAEDAVELRELLIVLLGRRSLELDAVAR